MSSIWGEYLQLIREIASDDMDNGNYVTMLRINHGFMIYEKVLTFSGITLERRIPKYACNAKTEESESDLGQNNEEQFG